LARAIEKKGFKVTQAEGVKSAFIKLEKTNQQSQWLI
jgi:ActR/RegA family two-component response regulator